MKRAAAILFLFLITWQIAAKVYIFIAWKINQDYIAQHLCENIDKPELGCEGNCHLAKQLDKTENSGIPYLPIKTIEKLELSCFDITGYSTTLVPEEAVQTPLYAPYRQSLNKLLLVFSVFHPPQHSLV